MHLPGARLGCETGPLLGLRLQRSNKGGVALGARRELLLETKLCRPLGLGDSMKYSLAMAELCTCSSESALQAF